MTSVELLIAYKISDMMSAIRIEEACKNSSASFEKVDRLEDLRSVTKIGNRVLLVCDLVSAKSELKAITEFAKESNWKVFGYYPHVDNDTRVTALSVGVDYVIPRSAMVPKLVALLD